MTVYLAISHDITLQKKNNILLFIHDVQFGWKSYLHNHIFKTAPRFYGFEAIFQDYSHMK